MPLFPSPLQSGDIAKHLEFVGHSIRTKLDELKRREVDRLNQIRKLLDARVKAGDSPVLGKRLPGLARGIPNISSKVVDAMLKAQGMHDPLHTHSYFIHTATNHIA